MICFDTNPKQGNLYQKFYERIKEVRSVTEMKWNGEKIHPAWGFQNKSCRYCEILKCIASFSCVTPVIYLSIYLFHFFFGLSEWQHVPEMCLRFYLKISLDGGGWVGGKKRKNIKTKEASGAVFLRLTWMASNVWLYIFRVTDVFWDGFFCVCV